jgi:outer membrane murein-binding lipoprotein Lpp
MSQTSKIVLGIAGVAVVLLAVGYYWHANQLTKETGPENAETTTLPSGQASDDTALEQDFGAIDTQLQAVGTDNANANESVNAAVGTN